MGLAQSSSSEVSHEILGVPLSPIVARICPLPKTLCERISFNGGIKLLFRSFLCDLIRVRFGVAPLRNLLCDSRPAMWALPPMPLSLVDLFLARNARCAHAFALMSPSRFSCFPVEDAVTALRRAPSGTPSSGRPSRCSCFFVPSRTSSLRLGSRRASFPVLTCLLPVRGGAWSDANFSAVAAIMAS